MNAASHEASDFAHTAAEFFSDLQARICAAFESFEPTARFQKKSWNKPDGHRLQGGGQMRVMRGQVFEKVGVNVSHVWGAFAPQHARQTHDPPGNGRATTNEPGEPIGLTARADNTGFIACGISLVAHMVNPYVPAVHMNLRYLRTTQEWFGGGADLTPTFPFDEDTADFHAALREPCEAYQPGTYQRLKEWCDKYFYLPHRQEPRGVGGIFFDELSSGDRVADFTFVRGVGEAFLQIYPKLVARRLNTPYDEAARERLLIKRGRYVEFNLVYDRGTKFGFGTDADPEAYLMSMPPLVKW